jgi:prepilin-type N-terminal cleavage/methylation domain-containing protein
MGRPRTNGFTLVEMIAVIVIMAIMLSITVPAVTNLMKANALRISNMLNLARQYAITHRTTTRVIFPYIYTSGLGPGLGTNQAPCYLSYAAIAIDEFYQATNYISRWEFLPTGVVFLHEPTGNTIVGALGNSSCLQQGLIPFPDTNTSVSLPPQQLAYIEFTPTGAASNPGTLTIQEGLLINGLPRKNSSNAVTATVDAVIGHIRMSLP